MAFDPDAYLQETGEFDPDEYLKGEKKRVPLEEGLPTTELPEYQNLGAAETIGAIPRKLKAMGGAVGGMVEGAGGSLEAGGALDKLAGSGLGDILTGGAGGLAGRALDKQGLGIADFEKEVGASIADYGRQMQEFYKIADPTFADKLTAAATSGAVFFIPGVGIARGVSVLRAFPKLAALTGSAASSAFESALEAGAVYETVKATSGKTEADALAAAGKTFGANLALNTGLNYAGGLFGKVLPGGGASSLKGAVTSGAKVAVAEGTQEGAQQGISNLATGRPVTEGMGESAVLGGIVGAGMSGAVDLAQRGPGGAPAPLAGQPLTGLPIEPQAAPAPILTPYDANVLEFQIKQALGLEPMEPLTQFHMDAAWEVGMLPADLAIKAGYQPAIQAGIAEKVQKQQAEAQKTAKVEEKAAKGAEVAAVDQAAVEQQAADEAVRARQDELMTPHPVSGKSVYQMSEEEFAAMVRAHDPEADGEAIVSAYDDLQTEAKDLGLTDDTEGYRAGEDVEAPAVVEMAENPVAKMDLAAAQAKFPGLTEEQHKAMVKQAVDAGQVLPEDVAYPDVKKYGVDKRNDEVTRLQEKEEDKSMPILGMGWRRKFNKAAFEKEGFDTSALPGYFVEKGGMTPELATENAYEDGVITEYAQDLYFEALDKEIMKKEAQGRDERTKWWARKRKDGFKEEGTGYKPINPEEVFLNHAKEKGYIEKVVGDNAYTKTRAPQSPQIKLLGAKNGSLQIYEEGVGRYEIPIEPPKFLMSPGAAYQPTVPPFYSKLQRLIEAKMSGPMLAAQLAAMIKGAGIKQEELEQYDLDTFLKDNPKPTKAQVLDYLRANMLEIKEVTKGKKYSQQDLEKAKQDFYLAKSKLSKEDNEALRNRLYKPLSENLKIRWEELEKARKRWKEIQDELDITDVGANALFVPEYYTKFSQYVLPGGENYREVLFVLLGRKTDLSVDAKNAEAQLLFEKNFDQVSAADQTNIEQSLRIKAHDEGFRSPHWDDINVLAHMRVNDRMVNGKKYLFLEESQSDWHQKGREVGYGFSSEEQSRLDKLQKDWENNVFDVGDLRLTELTQLKRRKLEGGNVPDAPLKSTWQDYVMKRAIRYAAENGYDGVAWTTGQQQFERWGSEEIVWQKTADGWKVNATEQVGGNAGGVDIEAVARERQMLLERKGETVKTQSELKAIIKGVLRGDAIEQRAEKISNRVWERMQKEDTGSSMPRREGLENLYDRQLRDAAEKSTKKWGGKAIDVVIKGGTKDDIDWNVHSLAITPEIRKGALTEGFSLFAPGKTYEAGHVYEQGELFPEEPVTQAALDQAVDDVRRVRPVGQWWDLRLKKVADKIEADFKSKGLTKYVGQKIDTIQDAAELAALARHPTIEHLMVTLLKGGKVTGCKIFTSGKVGSVDSRVINDILAYIGDADEFYVSHNHPTGNPTPSPEDIASTKLLAKFDKRFKGHVVTDHKTYTAIHTDGTAIAQDFKSEKQSFRSDMAKMEKSPLVVGWAQDVLQGGKLGIMFVDSRLHVMSFDQVDPRSDYNGYIKRHANKYGARGVFLITGEEAIGKMTPRILTGGNYVDMLVLKADGTYTSARTGHVPGFSIEELDKPQEGDFGFAESSADYNPEDYNKVLGRFKPGMELTLRSRIDTPLVKGGLTRGTAGKLVSVDPKTGEMLVDFAGTYMVVPPNMFYETYRQPGTLQPGQKERKFIQTVRGYAGTAPEVKDSIAGNYDVITNEQTLAESKAAIAKDYAGALRMAYETKEPTRTSNTISILLIDRFQQEGNFDEAKRLIEHAAERNTRAGQAVQALAMYRRLTPEGILRYAESVVKQAQVKGNFEKLVDTLKGLKDEAERVAFAKKHGIPYMSVQQANELYDMAIAVAKMEPGRARDIATGKMLAKISALVPKTFWEKVSSLQILAQLLNPKTFIRNIGGNSLFLAFENFAQAAGVPIDMLVGKVTGRRSVAAPSPATQAAGFKKGAQQGIEEALAGVEIQPINNKYDLPRASAFDSRVMKGLETLLNISLKATDRAFYQAAFEDSLRGQMKLAKVENPTPEMVQIAHLDGLYRTFNDENVLRTAFTKVKKAFNLGGKWGMGDMVIKYPGTPASILMRGIEYSPFGFMQAAYLLAKAGTKANFNQRAFVQSTARALTGTGLLMGTGMILAALGLIRGKDDDKKNIRETEAAIGVRDYQLNVSGLVRFLAAGMDPKVAAMRPGDLLVSYDWAQPAAINLAMGANIQRGAGESGVVMIADAIEGASTTLEQQPLLQGISRFFRGQSVTKGALESVKDVPASFIPTLLSQIKQWTDNTARNLNSPSYFEEMWNKVRNKLPGLSGNLPPRVDVLGRIRKTYQNDSNNVFNVFLNPAFVSRYKPTPTTDLVLDIWARTGDTIQMPRIVPREITVEKVKRPLTEMEQAQFQHYIGERTSNVFNALSADPDFMGMEDKDKAKELQGILTDIYNEAKLNVLGVE